MRLIALMCGILGAMAFFLLKTRLPPKPPGPFFHLSAFRNLVYICLCIGASVSWPSHCRDPALTCSHGPLAFSQVSLSSGRTAVCCN